MLPDRVSNPGPLTYESGALPIALRGPASKKGHNFVKNGGLPPLLGWVPLLIANNYSEFQVNIFSNNRDIRKCQTFRTTPPTTTPGL